MDNVELIEPDAELPGSESAEQPTSTEETAEQWLTPLQPMAEPAVDPNVSAGNDLDGAEAFPPPSFGGYGGSDDGDGDGGDGDGDGGGDGGSGGDDFGADRAMSSDEPAAVRARWARSEDRVVAGVSGGLGDALGLDPLIIRLGFVAVTALSAAGIPAYIAGWLLLRPDPYAPPISGVRKLIGAGLAGIAVLGILSNDGPTLGGNVLLAALLIGVAFAIWGPRRIDGGALDWRRSAEAAQENLRGAVGNVREATGNLGRTATQAKPAVDWVPRPRRVRKPLSPLGRFGFLAALVAGIGTYVFGGRDAEAATWGFGVTAAICGAALIVSLFWGRARWLVIPGLLAGGGAVLANAADWAGTPWATSGIDGYFQPTSATDVRSSYRYGSIDYTLDLTNITDDVTTELSGSVGNIVIYVPPTARVDVVARVGLGNIDFSDQGTNNFGRHDSQTVSFGPEGGNRIKLNLSVGVGGISIVKSAVKLRDDGGVTISPLPPISDVPIPGNPVPTLTPVINPEPPTTST
jgi:phage shock protein PspC (stress-responsive transcriptional regulator)